MANLIHLSFLINLLQTGWRLRYFVLLVIGILEGPVISMLAGFFIRLGYLSFWPAYLILMCGDLIGDAIWYAIGRFWGTRFVGRFGKYFGVSQENILKVEEIFHRYKNPILFISKITMGLGFALATLIGAGIVKIPFRRFMLLNLLGQFIWTGFLLAMGFFFGHLYANVQSGLARVSIITLSITVLLALFGFSRYLRGRIIKQ